VDMGIWNENDQRKSEGRINTYVLTKVIVVKEL
jgi:hypothetical protein